MAIRPETLAKMKGLPARPPLPDTPVIRAHKERVAQKQESAKNTKAANNSAQLDTLTNIYNKSGLETRISKTQAKKSGVVLQIDLSGFKSINDNYGHAAGDKALKVFAEKLKQFGIRKNDVVARIGGDEFAVVLLDTTLEQSSNRIEELNKIINQIRFSHEGKDLEFSARVGVGTFNNKSEIKSALRFADERQITIQRITTADRKIRGLSVR